MRIITSRKSARHRRGAILIVVLAMLALFAIVGLSFVLYADSQASASRNDRGAKNQEGEPNPKDGAMQALGAMVYDSSGTMVPLRGHGIIQRKYEGTGSIVPFSGTGLQSASLQVPDGSGGQVAIDQLDLVNYVGSGLNPPAGLNVPFTAADRHNLFLAIQDPNTGQITTKSFHRDDLFNLATPANTGDWTSAQGRYKLLRPRPADHNGFPYPPANADGSITGDVCNLKFTTGVQKNDSIWIYTGAPIRDWRGRKYTYLVAPLILDLSARINLSAAGSSNGANGQGLGPWEVDPGQLGGILTTNLLNLRQPAPASTPPNATPNERYTAQPMMTFNKGIAPPHYARYDLDGTLNGGDGPIAPAPVNGFSPFPTYPARYENPAQFAAVQSNHPAQFSPFVYPRGRNTTPAQHHFGLDEVIRLNARFNASKSSWWNAATLNSIVTTPQQRALTTPFNVSQYWGQVSILMTGGTATQLGPIDLNRPLADYRTNTTLTYHPDNLGNAVAAKRDRQHLAREIFLRLSALSGLVTGAPTQPYYDPTTGYIRGMTAANLPSFRSLAQFSVNIVDQIDSDDISTNFVWNPVVPNSNADTVLADPANFTVVAPDVIGNHVVFGTELPRLVVNEAYCELVNTRTDPMPAPLNMFRGTAVQKKFYVELHNPLSADSQLSSLGAARLRWQTNVSPDMNGTAGMYVGVAFSPYKLEVLEDSSPTFNAFTTGLTAENVTGDPSGADGASGIGNISRKISLDQFLYDATAPAPMPTLMNDDINLVQPASNSGMGAQGSNAGYYLIGPKDPHPAGGVTTTLCIADPPPPPMVPPPVPTPVQAMAYDAGPATNGGAMPNIATQVSRPSTVVLRRLANPYLPPAADNPYLTVDYLEGLPTRNRVQYDETPRAAPIPNLDNGPSVGRIHPYAHFRSNGGAGLTDAVVDQAFAAPPAPAVPQHTFFGSNTGLQNPNGLAWLCHFDRELLNSLELLEMHAAPPHQLTQLFFNGTLYQQHVTGTPLLLQGGYYRAFDLLTTKSRYVGTPLGGRIPGQVNINTIQDLRFLSAVLSPSGGNSFDATTVSNIWTNLNATRPLRGLAASTTADSTLLRSAPATPGVLLSATNNPTPLPTAINHPYTQHEPLRKGWKNLCTTSDGFLVIMTVGVFEVTNATGGPGGMPQLGKEMYRNIPGDTRQQFAAIIDRSQSAISDYNNFTPPTTKSWETELLSDVNPDAPQISVRGTNVSGNTSFDLFRDGQLTPVTQGSYLRIGFAEGGNPTGTPAVPSTGDGEWVQIAPNGISAGPPNSGTVILTLATHTRSPIPGPARTLRSFHGAGSPVRNVILGNPGPQPNFDLSKPQYQSVVPYFTRIDP